MNVALCSDSNYYEGLETALASIVKYSHPRVDGFCFCIVDGGITAEQKEGLRCLLTKLEGRYHTPATIEWQSIDPDASRFLSALKGSVTYYARLFLPQLFPDKSWILWIDADIFCMKDMGGISGHLDQSTPIFGVVDPGIPSLGRETTHAHALNTHQFDLTAPYINTGVCLIDLDLWRAENITQTLLSWACQHQDHLSLYDQSIINWNLADQLGLLPSNYNIIRSVPEAVLQMRNSPINYHFAGCFKPWKLNFNIKFRYGPMAFCQIVLTYEYLKFRFEEMDDNNTERLEKLHQAAKQLNRFLHRPWLSLTSRIKVFLYQSLGNPSRTERWQVNHQFYSKRVDQAQAVLAEIIEETESGQFMSSSISQKSTS